MGWEKLNLNLFEITILGKLLVSITAWFVYELLYKVNQRGMF